MRFFHHQAVHTPQSEHRPTPAPPPLPPFMTDEEEERSLCLLRETTTHMREGRQRLPTPDKVAIMELSSSFEKKRLGKQQQILSEITQRCREQEVTDLSSKISAKVLLKTTDESQQDAPPFLATSSCVKTRRSPATQLSAASPLSPADLRDLGPLERRLNFEKGYKFFPARRIIRHASKIPFFQGPVTAQGRETSHPDKDTYSPCMPPRANTDLDPNPDPELRAQTTRGPNTIQNYLQPKLDAVPPLLLADLHSSPNNPGSQRDRIGYYFSSSRLPLSQRSRTYFDTYRSSSKFLLPQGLRSTGGRRQTKSVRSERGLHNIIQQILSGIDTARSPERKKGACGEVLLNLKSYTPAVKREGQEV